MKRIWGLLLLATMLSFTSCGDIETNTNNNGNDFLVGIWKEDFDDNFEVLIFNNNNTGEFFSYLNNEIHSSKSFVWKIIDDDVLCIQLIDDKEECDVFRIIKGNLHWLGDIFIKVEVYPENVGDSLVGIWGQNYEDKGIEYFDILVLNKNKTGNPFSYQNKNLTYETSFIWNISDDVLCVTYDDDDNEECRIYRINGALLIWGVKQYKQIDSLPNYD